ncbi:unnamed protein product, partial [marine sediment metagenome]
RYDVSDIGKRPRKGVETPGDAIQFFHYQLRSIHI